MTASATIFAIIAAGSMLVDWWSVATRPDRVEAGAKPAVMIALIVTIPTG